VRKRQERPERPAGDETRSAGGIGWRAAVLALAVVLVYANSLRAPFVIDDQAAIVQNEQIRDLSRPSAVLLPDSESPVAGRPLVNLSFALNYAAGGLDVRGYHVVNIALHLACALLAFGFIRRTLELPRVRRRFGAGSIDLAFAAALLWAVHPLNSEVVDYLTQRSESLMALMYLLTLYAANRAVTEPRSRAWQTLAVAACALGMLCKESMATAPVMVALYDRVFAFDSWRDAVRNRWRLYAGLGATWVILAVIVLNGARSGVAGLSSGVSPWTYLLNQTIVITHYLRLSIWPSGLVVFYGWPAPLTLGDVVPYAVLILALMAATIAAFARAPAVGFLGAWFFLTLAPASSVVPVATEVGAERRMYLPLLALVVLTVAGGYGWWLALRYWRLADVGFARVIAGIAVTAASLALATVPWRIVQQAEFEIATYGSDRCFIVAARETRVQLYCPGRRETTVVVEARDKRLVRLGTKQNVFSAVANGRPAGGS